jgi:peptidoglycan/LPS O-acetylase OafA/YrhL
MANLLTAVRSHENNFNVVRLTLATLVVAYHAFCLNTMKINAVDPATKFLTQLAGIDLGRFSVDMFFIISGIFVTQSWLNDPHVFRFAARRIVRLIPALFFCTVITTSIAALFFSNNGIVGLTDRAFWLYIAKTSFLLDVVNFGVYIPTIPGVFQNLDIAIINGSLWTLIWEARFYIILGLLGSVFVFHRKLMLVVACFVFLLLIVFEKQLVEKVIWELDLFSCFLGGIIIGCSASLIRSKLFYGGLFILLGMALSKFYHLIGILVIGGAITIFVGSAGVKLSKHMQFNDYSYGVYIYHWPIMQMLRSASEPLDPFELFVLTALVVLPVAALSWHFIEAPSMAAIKIFLRPSRVLEPRKLSREPVKTVV